MAELKNGKVIVGKGFEPIAEQGFGELVGKALVLAPFEALYLVEKKKIEVTKGKKKLEFSELFGEFEKKNKRTQDLFLVFKDLRAAGYVARDGKTETPCFRVYARGARPGEEPSRYLVWVIEEKMRFGLKDFESWISRAHAVRKKPILAVVRQGTVTYFKIDTSKF